MADKFQFSFTAGEITPQAFGRVDLQKYQQGLRTMRNFYVQPLGGAATRTGSPFIGYTKEQDYAPLDVPFEYNADQQYVLEFGHETMRVKKSGGYVLDPHSIKVLSNMTQAKPPVISSTGHSLNDGDYVHIYGIQGMYEVNDTTFIAMATTANTFSILPLQAGDRRVITNITQANPAVVTYQGAALSTGDYVKITGVGGMVEVNDRYFYCNNATATTVELQDLQAVPANINSTGYTAFTTVGTIADASYDATGHSAYVADGKANRIITISDITQANPAVVTTNFNHGLSNGDWVYISRVGGMTAVNGKTYIVANVAASTFELTDIDGTNVDSTGYDAHTWGGTSEKYTQLTTPFRRNAEFDDLSKLKYDQSADVLSVCVAGTWWPREITRGDAGDHDWSISLISFAPLQAAPTITNVEQSYNINIDNIQKTNPIKIHTTGTLGASETSFGTSMLTLGTRIIIDSVTSTGGSDFENNLNGKSFIIVRTDSSNGWFSIAPVDTGVEIDSSGWAGTYDADTGKVYNDSPLSYRVTAVNGEGEESLSSAPAEQENFYNRIPDTDYFAEVTITPPSGADPDHYNVYRMKRGIYGYVGSWDKDDGVFNNTYFAQNIDPDITDVAPPEEAMNPFCELEAAVAITTVTAASQARVTCSVSHGYLDKDVVKFEDIEGTPGTEWEDLLNDKLFEIEWVSATQFDLKDFSGNDVDTSSITDTFSSGNVKRCDPNYYPATVSFHQQRRMFGRSDAKRQRVWGTQIGNLYNFNESSPRKADDALSFDLVSTRANEIRHLVSMQQLFVFTSGGEWVSTSGDNGYTPENIRNQPHSTNGVVNNPKPLRIADTILYIQEMGNSIWDLRYSFDSDSYGGNDRTVLSEHLFEGRTVVSWDYQRIPTRIVWCVLDDGTLAAMTYLPEFNTWGWSRHDTDGKYENVTVINEGTESFVYVTVRRVINGSVRRFSERFASRAFDNIRDYHGVDCGVIYDDPQTISAISLTNPCQVTVNSHTLEEGDRVDLSDIVGTTQLNDNQYTVANRKTNTFELMSIYTNTERTITGISQGIPGVVTYTGERINDGDYILIGSVAGMTELNGRYFKAAATTTTTFELTDLDDVNVDTTVYTAYTSGGTAKDVDSVDATGYTAYVESGYARKAVTALTGLDHLEGKTVSILANGNSEPQATVTGGAITIPTASGRVHIGLPYTCQLATLNVSDAEGQLAGRLKNAFRAVFRLSKSREVYAGPYTAAYDKLNLLKEREFEDYNEPTQFEDGERKLEITPQWGEDWGLAVQQTSPLPVTIQGIGFEFNDGVSDG